MGELPEDDEVIISEGIIVRRYRNLIFILDPDPTEIGGQVEQFNDIALADAILALEASIGSASVGDDVGSPLTVQDEGAPLVGAPHSVLDFAGAGVTATNAGGGKALIAIAGGGGGGGGGFDFDRGTQQGSMLYRAAVVGAPATNLNRIDTNPSNDDTCIVRATSFLVGDVAVFVVFKSALGPPFNFNSPNLEVRIEGTKEATLQNMVDGLNNAPITPTLYSDAAVSSRSGDTITSTLNDFTSSFNGGGAFTDTSGNFTLLDPHSVGLGRYGGGLDAVAEDVITAGFSDFDLETPTGGATMFLSGKMKTGTHTPEILGAVTGDAIVATPNIIFDDLLQNGVTLRRITIPPTTDLVVGTAVVNWTWNGKPFAATVTKSLF